MGNQEIENPPLVTPPGWDDRFEPFPDGPMPGTQLPCGCYIRLGDYEAILCPAHLAEVNSELRVWTKAELQDRRTPDLPKIRRPGDRVRVAARFTPRPEAPDSARYELISPCCGKRTYVDHGFVRRMITGQWPDQSFECGKPWAGGRGNPRNGGCRARYEVQPALIDSGHPTAFDLIWTGHGEISRHPGGPGPSAVGHG